MSPRSILTVVASLAASLAIPASSPAATTIGSDLASPAAGFVNCASGCTATTTGHPVNPIASPIDGVIVRWRTRFGDSFAPVKLRVLNVTGNVIAGIRSGPPTTVPAGLQTFAISPGLPIAAGERIGVDVPADTMAMVFDDLPGATFLRTAIVGDGASAPGSAINNVELLLNADIEPDCDRDGFGDETQDDLADCAPPDTTITAGPKDKTKKKQATFEFSGTDARAVAGFECSLDGGAFAACTSPHAVKVKKGKHSFQVRAIDLAGNVGSPAADDWKVKKKRKRK